MEDLAAPFKFDILVQLVNIPARITIHELQHLSIETRDALREALADFVILDSNYIPDRGRMSILLVASSFNIPSITFTTENMLVKSLDHVHPLYYI